MKLIVTVILFLNFSFAAAQKVDKKYIDWWMQISGQKTFAKSDTLYVVDGILYQQKENEFLNNLSVKNLATLLILPDTSSTFDFISNVVVIQTKGSQRKKVKRKTLLDSRAKFVDNYLGFSSHFLVDSKDPVLMINDIAVHATESKIVINKLKFDSIYAITIYSSKFDSAYFGQNAKNGLVQIWTYPKKK